MAETHPNFTRMITEICSEESIGLKTYSENWAFRLEKDGKCQWIVGYQFPLNTAPSKELCQDKALTSEVLSDFSIANIPHEIIFAGDVKNPERKEKLRVHVLEWISKYGAVVLKDNYGTGGTKVFRIENADEFFEMAEKLLAGSHAVSLSPFVVINEEYRVSVLDGEPKQLIRKERAFLVTDQGEKVYLNWRHNLGQGATGILVADEDLKKKLYGMAEQVVKALNITFASVDIVDVDGNFFVLEVNGGVMMEYFSGQDENCYAHAKAIYREAILKMFQ